MYFTSQNHLIRGNRGFSGDLILGAENIFSIFSAVSGRNGFRFNAITLILFM